VLIERDASAVEVRVRVVGGGVGVSSRRAASAQYGRISANLRIATPVAARCTTAHPAMAPLHDVGHVVACAHLDLDGCPLPQRLPMLWRCLRYAARSCFRRSRWSATVGSSLV
jgi:hypothetical protein